MRKGSGLSVCRLVGVVLSLSEVRPPDASPAQSHHLTYERQTMFCVRSWKFMNACFRSRILLELRPLESSVLRTRL